MVIITKIYEENEHTAQMVQSFRDKGYEVAVLRGRHMGNGATIRELYECYKRAVTGHDTFVYSDGGDTYCQRMFDVPQDRIIYSAEKHCWPDPSLAAKFPKGGKTIKKWKYLNGGGYGGSLPLMIEFMEKYGLTNLPNAANGQKEQIEAFLAAKADKFPIFLDYKCEIFQPIGHMEEGDFGLQAGALMQPSLGEFSQRLYVSNMITGSVPAIIHANGRTPTPAKWPFKIF